SPRIPPQRLIPACRRPTSRAPPPRPAPSAPPPAPRIPRISSQIWVKRWRRCERDHTLLAGGSSSADPRLSWLGHLARAHNGLLPRWRPYVPSARRAADVLAFHWNP